MNNYILHFHKLKLPYPWAVGGEGSV